MVGAKSSVVLVPRLKVLQLHLEPFIFVPQIPVGAGGPTVLASEDGEDDDDGDDDDDSGGDGDN